MRKYFNRFARGTKNIQVDRKRLVITPFKLATTVIRLFLSTHQRRIATHTRSSHCKTSDIFREHHILFGVNSDTKNTQMIV